MDNDLTFVDFGRDALGGHRVLAVHDNAAPAAPYCAGLWDERVAFPYADCDLGMCAIARMRPPRIDAAAQQIALSKLTQRKDPAPPCALGCAWSD